MNDDAARDPSSPKDEPLDLPPRVRRILRIVYAVEGVAAARVWLWQKGEETDAEKKVALGVRGTMAISPTELLRRVEMVVAPLREPDETWEFGLLEEES
jgi:hypothetical protein